MFYTGTLVFIVMGFVMSDSHFLNTIIRHPPPRPICTPEQSCSYTSAPYTFELCDCPSHQRCPKRPEYSTIQDGTLYHFCTPREIRICKPDEYAHSITGILTSVHCICPDGLSLVKGPVEDDGTAKFYCGLKILD